MIYPKQKISNNEKTPEWFKTNADWHVEQTTYYSNDRWEMIMLYRAALGYIDEDAYAFVLNPYNSPDENRKKYPAQMRNYDIILPIINLFLGEKAQRPFNGQVIVLNSDAPSINKDEVDKAFMGVLAQKYINVLNESGVNTGVPTQETPEFQELMSKYKVGADDKRAIFGQEAVEYLKYHLNLKDKYQDAFYDWLVTGRCFSYKDAYKGEVLHEICPTLECWHGTTRTGFVEDGNWFVRRTRYNLNNCIDRFAGGEDGLTDEEIDQLEAKYNSGNVNVDTVIMNSPNIDSLTKPSDKPAFYDPNGLIDVFHIVWKGLQQYGILKYQDQVGQIQEMEVDESYQLNKANGDISISWEWRSRVYEVYKLGDLFYKRGRELPIQREELNNSSVCKLPYNGRVGYTERDTINSVVKQILPYQVWNNICHFRAELTLARNKDKIMTMPLGLIPDKWGEDKFMYFLDATSIAFFDETKPNAAAVMNSIRSIDMNLGTYIAQMRDLFKDIRMEAWEAIGMNRQRYGDVNSSDGKSVNEQASIRSATISREMCRRFERFQETDVDGLLDYSKVAWINGKKGMYINSDGQAAFLEVNPDEHLGTDYKTFFTDSIEEHQNLQMAKDYSFGWAQKGNVPASTVISVIKSNNIAKLENIIKVAEDIQKQYEEGRAQADRENLQVLQDKKDDTERERNQVDIQKASIGADASIKVAEINAGAKIASIDSGNDGSDAEAEILNDYRDYVDSIRSQDLEAQKLSLARLTQAGQARLEEVNLMIKNNEIKSKEKIAEEKNKSAEKVASMNKNKYDRK